MLIAAENISKSFGGHPLFRDITLFLNEGDKIGVVGINGAGKSTFLNIIARLEEPDSGTVSKNPGVRIEYLRQNPTWDDSLSVLEHVFRDTASSVRETKEYEAKTILTRLGITDFDRPVGNLSGGQKRRVSIASALVHPCEVLILDEPTNHLDNEMVVWLEKYLAKYAGAMIMVTHDRYFLDRVTNKIVEIDRGSIYTYQANYSKYIELKAEREDMALGTARKNRSILRRELEWMQQGPKARGTKSRERIARFEALSAEKVPAENAKLEMSSVSSRLGRKTIEINDISKSFGGAPLIRNFSHIVARDARIGVIGANGCGKSTLLNLMCGRLVPDNGSVVFGETVKIGYFSQDSSDMDGSMRVIEYIREFAETIETPEGSLSASQMLEKFLFTPEMQWTEIRRLSGGERRRLYLLSILISAPNILLLDEPTNDLDIQTLGVLEDYLDTFRGPVITVSHDRYFLDKVVDTIFEFRENGEIVKYVGGYTDYLDQVPEAAVRQAAISDQRQAKDRPWTSNRKLKFSYNEQREYEKIDEDIAFLEAAIRKTAEEMEARASDYIALQELMARKEDLEKQLEEKTERWIYLNELAEKIAES